MTDLRERFRVLDELEVPDVMARAKLIGPKPPAPEPTVPVARRVGALVFAIGLATVAILLAICGLDHTTSRPTVQPSPFQPSPTFAPPISLLDISFVDIATGGSTLLPRSIRSIPEARHFQVSPDGDRLAFDDGDEVYVANVDGTNLHRIADGLSAPSWSPDGTTLVCVGPGALVIVEVASGQTMRILPFNRDLYHPNFSADGQQILFTAFGFGEVKPATMWTIPATGGSAHPVPLPLGRHIYPAFGTYSPDGTTIAYRKTMYDGLDFTEMTDGKVWLADADGSDPRALGRRASWCSQMDPRALWPMWSPDGSRIAYEPLCGSGVSIVDLSGEVIRLGDGSDPSWLDPNTLIIQDYVPDDEPAA